MYIPPRLRYYGTTNNDEENVMTMYMNMHTIPAGKSMYTVHFTWDDESTPASEICTEEIDIVLPTNNAEFYVPNHQDFKMLAEAEYGEEFFDCIIVGVVNQSAGYVVFKANWDEEGNHEVDPPREQ